MMLYVSFEWPSVIAWLMALRSIARLAARRTRGSAHGDFGSNCSVNTIHSVNVGNVALSVRPGVRLTSSPFGPRIEYATSASARLSIARRVDSSGTDLKMRRFTPGVLRQKPSYASTTSSTPGLNDTKRYGPAPTGAFLKPSSPARSVYFFGTIQAAPVAGVA